MVSGNRSKTVTGSAAVATDNAVRANLRPDRAAEQRRTADSRRAGRRHCAQAGRQPGRRRPGASRRRRRTGRATAPKPTRSRWRATAARTLASRAGPPRRRRPAGHCARARSSVRRSCSRADSHRGAAHNRTRRGWAVATDTLHEAAVARVTALATRMSSELQRRWRLLEGGWWSVGVFGDGDRELAGCRRAAAGWAVDREGAAQGVDTVLQSDQARAQGRIGATDAVVAHSQQ